MVREDLRNIAIIAHVDHGKTTLVNEMLKQGGTFRDNQVVQDRVMDSGDLERERGITILAKNTSTTYNGVKINIVDTPGHADFGGEVERVLKMVDGVLLLVDAAEGPMPQTRFVLEKALAQDLTVIIVINKVDRPDARLDEVVDEVLELMLDLGASDEQLDAPVVFCSARQGAASFSPHQFGSDLKPLFDTILEHIAPPEGDENAPLGMLVSSVDYSSFVGRIGVGKITAGTIKQNMQVTVCDYHNPDLKTSGKITALYQYDGLKKSPVDSATVGDIVAFSGIESITIGNTICDPAAIIPIPFVKISEPTIEMTFSVNDSPFAGKEGKFVTSRQIRDRLYRELLKDVSLHVKDTDSTDSFRVLGRGEMHLSILIETMRREGYEFQVGAPKVLYQEIGGKKCEPIEEMTVDCPEEYSGTVIDLTTRRKGTLTNMASDGERTRLEFDIPSRGIIGLRSNMLTATAGEAIMTHRLKGFEPWVGEIEMRTNGSIISGETGTAYAYSIDKLQDRGRFFISPMEQVYAGQVIGEHTRQNDITVNVTKAKQLTNMRASGSDDKTSIAPPKVFTLEEALEYIQGDEYVEVTPHSMRLRKILLDENDRKRAAK